MVTPSSSRRRFLKQLNCAAVGSSTVLSTLLNLKLANQAAAQNAGNGSGAKALVCLLFSGGWDSVQMLVPYQQARYNSYATTRGPAGSDGGLAIPRASLLPLDGAAADFAFHPSMVGMHQMARGIGRFAASGTTPAKRRLAAITNIGTLVAPISKSQYIAWENGSNTSLPIPRALFSHSDQIEQWQTGIPQGTTELNGWAGRAADLINSSYNTGAASMSVSLSGNNLLQVGRNTSQFVITANGSTGMVANGIANQIKNQTFRNTVDQQYAHLLTQSFSKLNKESDVAQLLFQSEFETAGASLGTVDALFPSGNYLADNLKAILKTIKIRAAFGLRRQTFFINFGGWDMHGDLLLPQAELLSQVDAAITAFQLALEALNLADDVITFTASDFGRTLRSNGRGTDHALGGNAFVMGGPVDGGKVFGTFPNLDLESADDVGYGGRLLPSTSADVYFAEMLKWFGVSSSDMPAVLPNILNFWPNLSGPAPLGFIKPV